MSAMIFFAIGLCGVWWQAEVWGGGQVNNVCWLTSCVFCGILNLLNKNYGLLCFVNLRSSFDSFQGGLAKQYVKKSTPVSRVYFQRTMFILTKYG